MIVLEVKTCCELLFKQASVEERMVQVDAVEICLDERLEQVWWWQLEAERAILSTLVAELILQPLRVSQGGSANLCACLAYRRQRPKLRAARRRHVVAKYLFPCEFTLEVDRSMHEHDTTALAMKAAVTRVCLGGASAT